MINRRDFFAGLGGVALAGTFHAGGVVSARAASKAFKVNPKYAPQLVVYPTRYKRGTIVIDTRKRFLYLIQTPMMARRYGVGVGRDALAWSGTAIIGAKKEWPRLAADR